VDAFDGEVDADAAGTPFTQAGGHPYAISTSIDFNTFDNPEPFKGNAWPVEPVKDVFVDLPPGLVGNPTTVAQCSIDQLAHSESIEVKQECPPTSQIGTAFVRSMLSTVFQIGYQTGIGPIPVFNMVPPPGVPARFGFNYAGVIATLDLSVRGSDYGVSVNVRNISEGIDIAGTSLTVWGVPADPSHDNRCKAARRASPARRWPRSCATRPRAPTPVSACRRRCARTRGWIQATSWRRRSSATCRPGTRSCRATGVRSRGRPTAKECRSIRASKRGRR
jgi:hypothetical protein